MEKKEAIIAMTHGNRIRHRYLFSNGEWIEFADGKLTDENGYELDWNEFWSNREDECFDDGWEIAEREASLRPAEDDITSQLANPYAGLPDDYSVMDDSRPGHWYEPCLNKRRHRRNRR